MRHPVPIACVLLLLAAAGCTGWRRDSDILNTPVPQRQPLQIWSGKNALVAHGVQVRGDSVRAVPRWRPPECDSCARYYALEAIDSVRVREAAPIRTALLAAVLAAWAILTIGIAGFGGPGS